MYSVGVATVIIIIATVIIIIFIIIVIIITLKIIVMCKISGQDKGRDNTQLRQRAVENPTRQFSTMGFFNGLATFFLIGVYPGSSRLLAHLSWTPRLIVYIYKETKK